MPTRVGIRWYCIQRLVMAHSNYMCRVFDYMKSYMSPVLTPSSRDLMSSPLCPTHLGIFTTITVQPVEYPATRIAKVAP